MKKLVYLSLGSNIGDRLTTLHRTLASIAEIPGVSRLEASSIYETEPVSEIPQEDYLNAACRFLSTDLTAEQLLCHLEGILKRHGQGDRPKNAPRVIDIDILFFGCEFHDTERLQIPHPRWQQRLFVVVPLLDLTQTITIPGKNREEIVNLLALKKSLEKESHQRIQHL